MTNNQDFLDSFAYVQETKRIKQHREIIIKAYNRGLRMGILLAILLSAITFLITYTIMNQRLTDEATATNYYYNLTK